MADGTLQIYIDGPARLYINAIGSWNEQAADMDITSKGDLFGITESGIQISMNSQVHRIMSDDFGGPEGIPTEMLYMGSTASMRGVLVKYYSNTVDKAIMGLNINPRFGAGTVVNPGTPLLANGYTFSVLINGRNKAYYFPMCEMATAPREFNFSTTERKTSFTLTAYPDYSTADSTCVGALFYTCNAIEDDICARYAGVNGSWAYGQTQGDYFEGAEQAGS